MASLDSLRARSIASEGVVRNVVDDTPVAIQLWYVGTGTVTSVTVTAATNIVNITSDGGTDTYAFATYDTVTKLIAAINADGIFEVRVVDALLADSTANNFIDGAISSTTDEDGNTCWKVLVDTSATDYMTACLTPKGYSKDAPIGGHRVHLQAIEYNVDVNAGTANGVRVYRRRGATETQVWRAASVDATATTVTFASGEGKISGRNGDELIVRVINATSITDAAANFLNAVGILE